MNHHSLRGTTIRKLKLLGIALIGIAMTSQSAVAATIDVIGPSRSVENT
jgi:hypothetical protein